MSTPSSNLLAQALTAIQPTPVLHYKFEGRTTNDIGTYISTYDAPASLFASVHAVPRSVIQQLGLDFQKNYTYMYFTSDIIDIARNVSGDEFGWNNRRWKAESNQAWFAIDGWVKVLCVDIGTEYVADIISSNGQVTNILADDWGYGIYGIFGGGG